MRRERPIRRDARCLFVCSLWAHSAPLAGQSSWTCSEVCRLCNICQTNRFAIALPQAPHEGIALLAALAFRNVVGDPFAIETRV